MRVWQLQEAKAQLSEVVRLCAVEGPQMLTVRGKEEAVILSVRDYEKLAGKKQTFTELMRKSPLVGVDLESFRERTNR